MSSHSRMKGSLKVGWLLPTLALFAPQGALAQVHASLVSADSSIQAGHSATLALRLAHEPHWHTFWRNPGIGYATKIAWRLGPGWNGGELQWPTPVLIRDPQGNITGQGYQDVVYLPVTITAPGSATPGQKATIRAVATWLMCNRECVPGTADVELTLPVSAGAGKPNHVVSTELARTVVAEASPHWTLAANQDPDGITLTVNSATSMTEPHFFPENSAIQYDQPQSIAQQRGVLRLTLPPGDAHSKSPRLVGVLAYTDAGGAYRGLTVDVPIVNSTLPLPVGLTRSTFVHSTEPALTLPLLILAFTGGLILNLMPCVFPVLAIKVVGFTNQAGSSRRQALLHGISYTAGVLLSFWILAALLAGFRAGGQQLGWGFQLQSAPFVFLLAVLMMIFGLSLSGVFEFGIILTGTGSNLQHEKGYSGSFFTGVLATVVAAPCSAPFLAPALGAALTLPAVQSSIIFSFVAFGLSAPYLLLSAFPQTLNVLPKPGRWMETFKQIMAFPLYATTGYLIWVFAGETRDSELLDALFALTLIAMGAWICGRFYASRKKAARVWASVATIALISVGLTLGWPRGATADDPQWEPWSPERVTELRKDNRPIYVDFTARWCATCQANKRLVFGSEEVRRYIRAHEVALLEADWTNSDPRITAELARWNRAAVPFDLVYLPSAPGPQVLPEILTPNAALRVLRGNP
jgi:DsbC/DsbD-like thiol-disulfide interchange protein/cytochrome c biogenesis protein CcdA